jgi:hypothetical protein
LTAINQKRKKNKIIQVLYAEGGTFPTRKIVRMALKLNHFVYIVIALFMCIISDRIGHICMYCIHKISWFLCFSILKQFGLRHLGLIITCCSNKNNEKIVSHISYQDICSMMLMPSKEECNCHKHIYLYLCPIICIGHMNFAITSLNNSRIWKFHSHSILQCECLMPWITIILRESKFKYTPWNCIICNQYTTIF